ncbi:hypothetical protein DTO271G3_2166 [Paecilomyces variotii]|nr:hypothetical protein DTO271G3_2166 [Paecilomyces variotii]
MKDLLEDWVTVRREQDKQDPNIGFVETLYQICSTALVYLWRSRLRFLSPSPHKKTLRKDVLSIWLWEENFPAGHLDHILAQSDRLKRNVVENLQEIGSILLPDLLAGDDGTISDAENGINSTHDLVRELRIQLEKAEIILSAEEHSDWSSGDDEPDERSLTECEPNRYGRLHCYVNCLVDLAPLIETYLSSFLNKAEPQPSRHENVFHISPNAQPFAMRIRDRFANAPVALVERLAEANWERLVRIRAQTESSSEEDRPSNTDALTVFKPYSLFHDSGLGTSVRASTQYAATISSHTSFLTAAGEEAQGRPRVPPLPQKGGQHFQCDYCRKNISVRNRIEWKMHVFADLQSYICTHPGCKDALKTFPSRRLWEDHEFNEHFTRVQWRCFTCQNTTSTQQRFVDHLIQNHDPSLAGHRLTAAIAEAEEIVLKSEFSDHSCALCCQAGWPTRKAYATHVGKHLEEISLACLPRDQDSGNDVDCSGENSSNATKISNPHLRNLDHDGTHPQSGEGDIRLPNTCPSLFDQVTVSEQQPSDVHMKPRDHIGIPETSKPPGPVQVPQKNENAQMILKYVAQALKSQGPFAGWRAEVPIQERAMKVYQMISSLRLIQPKIELQSVVQEALRYEEKVFRDAGEKVDYEKECTDKLVHIRDTRARQATALQGGMMQQTGASVHQDLMQPAFSPQMNRPIQASPMGDPRTISDDTKAPSKSQQGPSRSGTPQITHGTPSMPQATTPNASGITQTPVVGPAQQNIQSHQSHIMLPHQAQPNQHHQQQQQHNASMQKLQSQQTYQAQLMRAQLRQMQMAQEQQGHPGQQQYHQGSQPQITPQQQMLPSTAQTNSSHLPQNFQDMAMNQRYQQLYQQRLLRLRQEMATRYMPEYGPPTQYPPHIAQQYGPGLERSARAWVQELIRRERESGQQ